MSFTDNTVNLDLGWDLKTRRLVSGDGAQAQLSAVTLGDTLLCKLRCLESADDGTLTERDLPVRTIRASLTRPGSLPPSSGSFSFRIGTPTPTLPAVLIFPAVNAQWLMRVAVYDAGAFVPTHELDHTATPFATLAESLEWFADNADFFTITGPDTDGNVTVTAEVLGTADTRRLEVTYKDLDGADMINHEFETPGSTVPTSALILFEDDAETFATTLAPLFPGRTIEDVTTPAAGCWVFRFVDGLALPAGFSVASNRLEPQAFVRVRTHERYAGELWHEVRLIQAPLAWNEDGYERVLPPPPSISRMRSGDAGSDTQPPVNEIQILTLPPDFRGTYCIRWNFRVTRPLSRDDGPDEIAEALNAMWEDGRERIKTTNPEPNKAYIEFSGPLAGAAQPLATVEVITTLPGVLTFRLPLTRPELNAAMRAVNTLALTLEVELEIGDPDHPEQAGRIVTAFRAPLTVEREEIWAELATVPKIDWLRPPSPRSYIPFSPDQIIVGVQHYEAAFGDGAARVFSFPHNLGTDALHVSVRENVSGGRALILGKDYGFNYTSENELVLGTRDDLPPPAANSLAVLISSAGPKSAFLDHTHEMAQVNGLLDALALMQAQIESLQDLLPTSTLARREETSDANEIELPDLLDIFPSRTALDVSKITQGDLGSLTRSPAMLPALHVAAGSVLNYAAGALPMAAGNAGKVWQNETGAQLMLAGGSGRRSSTVAPHGYFGSDGRFVYPVTRAKQTGTTDDSNSFFPADFERELFLLHVNDAQWQPGGRLSVSFELNLQLLRASSRAQYMVVIEAGTAPGQTTPAPTGANLEKIEWAALPMLAQRVVLSGVRTPHKFGVELKRAADNTLSGEALYYTAWTAAPALSIPAAPAVVLRARLVQFDTENSVTTAAGFVFVAMTKALAAIS